MSIKITRVDSNSKTIVFGIEYKNNVTGISSYREVVLSRSDFVVFPPLKAEVLQKLKTELTKPSDIVTGNSILQEMKANTTVVPDAFVDISTLKNLDISTIEQI